MHYWPGKHKLWRSRENPETTKMQFPDLKSLRNLFLSCQAMRTLQVLSERPHSPLWFKMTVFTAQASLTQKPRHARKRAWLPHSGPPCLDPVQPSNQTLPWSVFAAGWEATGEVVQGLWNKGVTGSQLRIPGKRPLFPTAAAGIQGGNRETCNSPPLYGSKELTLLCKKHSVLAAGCVQGLLDSLDISPVSTYLCSTILMPTHFPTKFIVI